jgi:hypothetical protein
MQDNKIAKEYTTSDILLYFRKNLEETFSQFRSSHSNSLMQMKQDA